MPEVMQGLQGDSCQTAEQGTPCWRDVTWLQTTGFKKHPEWYPGYSSKSSFEDVQLLLYRNGKVHCPKPCLANVLGADHEAKPEHVLLSSSCMDAVEGDLCFRTVRWLKRTGLEQHPDWFPALEASDSTVTIQAELHRQGKSQCRRPCARSSPAGDDDVTTTGESPPYQALGAQKAGLRVRVGSGDAASWVWDFPKEEVVPTTAAGKTLMQCLRKLLHVTPENFNDMRALCEALVPLDGEVQHHALVKESMKFITWAQHHVDELRAKRREQDEQLEISDPAARPELREGDCLTAQPNTVCYTAVSYGLSEGIRKHPLVYEGLSEHASFEKVQEFLWLNKRHGCTKPCPRKRARDITEFYKHPEALRYKKRAADMSIDEMSRYISGEWDGYVSRMFDADADDLGTLNQHAPASTAKPAVGAASREDRAIAEPVDQAVQTKIAEVAANDTGEGMAEDPEPEKSASDEDVANASTENGFTPIFSDVVSINMSDVSEGVANVTPIFSDVVSINMSDVSEGVANVSEREASVSEPDSDPISQREKDLAEREKAIAEREKAIADLEKTLSALGSEKALATLDAVAVAPKEPVADTPTKAVADAPTEEDSTAAQPISTVAVANAPLEPVADAPTQADATAAEPTSNDAVANAPLEPVADAPTQADATAAEPTSNDAGANALPEPVAETPTQADSTAAEPTSNDAVADALPEPVADTPTQSRWPMPLRRRIPRLQSQPRTTPWPVSPQSRWPIPPRRRIPRRQSPPRTTPWLMPSQSQWPIPLHRRIPRRQSPPRTTPWLMPFQSRWPMPLRRRIPRLQSQPRTTP
ncbi:unnamed protein product [Prorocentrum cordatum]|uniref:Uncharacterized protein n=1 Tax=Prorocentrum cordatum TaxID=2364126 RepID=A0ABN9QTP3_9DINO|nr:unnamed protein product [Polarella glacialis]